MSYFKAKMHQIRSRLGRGRDGKRISKRTPSSKFVTTLLACALLQEAIKGGMRSTELSCYAVTCRDTSVWPCDCNAL